MLVFEERNLSEQGRESTTNLSTYDAESGNRTRATLVGGECSHHCAISASMSVKKVKDALTDKFVAYDQARCSSLFRA